MFTIVSEQHKIFNAIIRGVFVNVMHHFFRQEITSKMFFHYKAMLEDIILFIAKRMMWFINKNITLMINLSALPRQIIFAFFKTMSIFRSRISLLKFCFMGGMLPPFELSAIWRMAFTSISTFFRTKSSNAFFNFTGICHKFCIANFAYSFYHIVTSIKKAAFRFLTDTRLSVSTLRPPVFKHKNSVNPLDDCSIAQNLGMST